MSEDSLDSVWEEVGFGRWQLIVLALNGLIWSVLSPHTISSSLLNAPVDFRCQELETPYDTDEKTDGQNSISNVSNSSFLNNTSSGVRNSSYYNYDVVNSSYSNYTGNYSFLNNNSTGVRNSSYFNNVCLKEHKSWDGMHGVSTCPSVAFDGSIFTNTITTEWNLICGNSLGRPMFQNIYIVGTMLGGVIGGIVGDRFGRVAAIRLGSFFNILSSMAVAFTPYFGVLLVARLFLGLTTLMVLINACSLALETCPAGLRNIIGMGIGIPNSIGVMVFGLMGYYIRTWRYLYMATSFPVFLILPISMFLDESPRWLLQKNRAEEAKQILVKAAKYNRHSLPKDVDVVLDEITKNMIPVDSSTKINASDRLRAIKAEALSFVAGKGMRLVTLVTPLIWVSSDIIYYGIIFNANNFYPSNPFLYIILTGFSDAVAIIISTPFSNWIGRRNTIGISQLGAGFLIIIVLFIPEGVWWMRWFLTMTGFLMAASAGQILFVYTPELFPTTLRTRGLAFSNLTGHVGTFIAPLITEYMKAYGWWATDVCLGLCGIFGGVIIYLLPETKDLPLCETVQDIEIRMLKYNKKPEEKYEAEAKSSSTEDLEPVVESSNPVSQKREREDSFASVLIENDQQITDDKPHVNR